MKDKLIATNIKTKYEYKYVAERLKLQDLQDLGAQGWLLVVMDHYDYIFARLTDLVQDTQFIDGSYQVGD